MYVFPRKVPGAIYCEIKCLGQSNQNSCPEKLHVPGKVLVVLAVNNSAIQVNVFHTKMY